MRTVTIKDRQTLFDVAVAACGTVEAVFVIAQMNGKRVTDELENGDKLVVPEAAFPNQKTVEFFKDAWYPMSGDMDADVIPPGGIGYMQIGTNFIVS